MNLEEQILRLVADKPGVMAKQLADKLSITRKEVNAILYGPLSSKLTRDDTFKWYPVSGIDTTLFVNDQASKPFKKDSIVKHGTFRGRSLFTYHESGDDVEITYNSNHPFFKNVYESLNGEGKAAVDALTIAFATAASENYDLADHIEDLIDKWGKHLYKALNAVE